MKINIQFYLCFLLLSGCFIYCSDGSSAVPIDETNLSPVFNTPIESIDYRDNYEYKIIVTDPEGNNVEINVTSIPEWLNYDAVTKTISGFPGWENRGGHDISINATDGKNYSFLSYTLNVIMGEINCEQEFSDPDSSLYVLPFKVGSTYKLEQGYCPANPTWGHHNWFAYDFNTAIGDTIVATRAGTVLFTRGQFEDGNRFPGRENFVFIRHADNTVMHYMHLTKNGPLVNVGDIVEQGQPIALSGDSGNSAGPHVHVAVFRDNTLFSKEATLPLNFRNAEGIINNRNGLVHSENYKALQFVPDKR